MQEVFDPPEMERETETEFDTCASITKDVVFEQDPGSSYRLCMCPSPFQRKPSSKPLGIYCKTAWHILQNRLQYSIYGLQYRCAFFCEVVGGCHWYLDSDPSTDSFVRVWGAPSRTAQERRRGGRGRTWRMLVAGKGLDEDLAPPLAQSSPPPGREGRAREEREREPERREVRNKGRR